MFRRLMPSPAMVVAAIALFVSLGGVSYGLATGSIDSREILDGSVRNPDFKNGTLRGQEAKRDGFGGGAIKESTLGQVPNSATAEGVTRQAVVTPAGTSVRVRGVTSTARSAEGQYDVVLDRDVTACTYAATIGDEATAGPGTGQIAVASMPGNANGVRVRTRNSDGSPQNRSFHLIVSC